MESGRAFPNVRRVLWAGVILGLILLGGTVGYWIIGEGEDSLLDCLYMTTITITTIGFGEVVDVSASPGGKVFTMFLALAGVGTATFILSVVTAFLVEGDINLSFKRRKMHNLISKCDGHYIVCGCGRVGRHVIDELHATKRQLVLVDIDEAGAIRRLQETYSDLLYVVGDASDNEVLLEAGIHRAAGLFATTSDDNLNLVVSLTAKQLNPDARVIANCRDLRNTSKMEKVGADAVISSEYIAGLRMTSEMIRPKVVTFLDRMLRDKDANLRIEEIPIPEGTGNSSVEQLRLERHGSAMLLAVRHGDDFVYNPPGTHILRPGDVLIMMTTPDDRLRLERTVIDM